MPISQLVRALSSHRERRAGELSEARRSGPMDCSTSFEVVAEVVPLSPGSRAGSMCSLASSASGEGQQPADIQQAPTDGQPRASSSSAALLASSLSGPPPSLPSTSSGPATERALRARGKAMLRSEHSMSAAMTAPSPAEPNLQIDLQHQLSLESSSSMLHSLPSASGGQTPSPRFTRSSTAPLPASLRAAGPGSLAAAVAAGQQQHPSQATGKGAAAASRPAVLHDLESEEGDDDLVHPMSPAAAAAADEAPEHCHWEDGVIASWLQGIDHSELLHDGEDEEEAAPQPAGAVAGASCSKAAASAALNTSASVPNTVLYSSLLYK